MRVLRFVARRLILTFPVLLGTLLLAFFVTRTLPGNPVERVAGPYATAERRAELKREAHLDRPFAAQFGLYVAGLVRGDLGTSYNTGQDVTRDLRQRFPATLELVLTALFFAFFGGVALGTLGGMRHNTWADAVGRVLAVLGTSVPVFWLGLVLSLLLFLHLRVVPAPTGRLPITAAPPPGVTGLYTVDALLAGQWGTWRAAAANLFLPALTLALVTLAPIARMTRASVLEVLGEDFVRTARAFGWRPATVVRKAVLRNALIPVLTLLVGVLGYAIGGAVLVEVVFAWPGLGRYLLDAILASDFPAIQGTILLVALVYVLLYLLLDILVAVIDPRVEVG